MTRNPHRRDALARLVEGVRAHAPAAFSCSFGLEDMVLVDGRMFLVLLPAHARLTDISSPPSKGNVWVEYPCAAR